MSLSYEIVSLECDTTNEQYPLCVTTVHYTISKTEGENTASTYGSVSIQHDESADYIEYEQLTKEVVVSWLGLDEAAIDEALSAQLAELATPSTVSMEAPWTVVEEAPVEEPSEEA